MSKKNLKEESVDVMRYLSDIASVRAHINNVMSVSRGVVEQKLLHKVSGVAGQLDRLFVKTLLESNLTGVDQEEEVDVAKRIAEEKAKLAEAKKGPQASVVATDSGVKIESSKAKKSK